LRLTVGVSFLATLILGLEAVPRKGRDYPGRASPRHLPASPYAQEHSPR